MENKFRILHFTDAHFGVHDPHGQRAAIAHSQIQAAHACGVVPDLCVFSGDLAQSGDDGQFAEGQEWLRQLMSPWPHAKLIIVPGNHDVKRSAATAALFRTVAGNERAYADWRQYAPDHCTHLHPFLDWHQRISAHIPLSSDWHRNSPFAFRFGFDFKGMPIHVIGLNSSLFSCNDEDTGNLVIDAKTLSKHLDSARELGGLVIAIAHHPVSDLVPWNRDVVERLLSQQNGAHLLLRGHLHEHEGLTVSRNVGSTITTLATGASYQTDGSIRNTFATYELSFKRSQIQTQLFEYSPHSGNWRLNGAQSETIAAMLPPPPRRVRNPKSKIEKALAGATSPEAAAQNGHPVDRVMPMDQNMNLTQPESDLDMVLKLGADIQSYLAPYLHKSLIVTPEIADRCYALKYRIKDTARISEKLKSRSSADPDYSVRKMPDVCGFRIVTMYQDQIPETVKNILALIEAGAPAELGLEFAKNHPVEIDVNVAKMDADQTAMAEAIRSAFANSSLAVRFNVKQRPTGYSSVHLVAYVTAPPPYERLEVIPIEVQIRSALEDVWGDIDYRLRYGRGRGDVGVSWMRHLNVLKGMIDALVGYVDVIKRHSEEEPVTAPVGGALVRSMNSGEMQLNRFKNVPEPLRSKMRIAFGLWEEAQDRRTTQGGSPGLFRQAADAFLAILHDVQGARYDNEPWKEDLVFALKGERAYMLVYTGDSVEQLEAETIYRELLQKKPDDAASNYRLGNILRERGDYESALHHSGRAITTVEQNGDEIITKHHWAFDEIRRGFGLTYWRMSEQMKSGDERKAGYLAEAIKHARSVIVTPADPENRLSAINDILYYNWELLEIDPGSSGQVSTADAKAYKYELFEHFQKSKGDVDNLGWHWLDTLARLFHDELDKAREIAMHLELVLENRVRAIRPNIELAKKGSVRWTIQISQHLTADEADALVFCQEILEEVQR
ncbi:metallophosphoesterase [Aliirhizobium smilacinae]|uniref:metallophosphoesterase n=1 Tax=Aliirhizobium smilacinae TaxID=1395944 RepID=UPI0015D65533|nr:metallophosphoesterase [Rhizobium smilacinae]